MCGRATLSSPAEDIAEIFEAEPIDIGPPRFNIAPSQPILTVRLARAPRDVAEDEPSSGAAPPRRELALLRWGLIPWWAKPEEAKKIAARCVQARAETAARTPAYRDAFRRHRCLVVIDGFFEWKTLPDGRRVPHHIRRSGREPFAIAAVWDSWRPKPDPDATGAQQSEPERVERVETCAVLTTRSGGAIAGIHDRMPLVLPRSSWDAWLGGSVEEAEGLLRPSRQALDERAGELTIVPVSTWVNDARHDDPRCIEPAPEATATATPGQIDLSFSSKDGPAVAARSARGAVSRRRRSS